MKLHYYRNLFRTLFTLTLVFFARIASAQYIVFQENNDLYGVIDTMGNIVLSGFDNAEEYDDCFVLKKGSTYTAYNWKLQKQYEGPYRPTYDWNLKLKQFVAVDRETEKYGVLTTKGKIVVPFIYTSIYRIEEGYIVEDNKYFGMITTAGKQIIPATYTSLEMQKIGSKRYIAAKSVEGKAGYLNHKNQWIPDMPYNEPLDFINGFASVKKGEQRYLINKNADTVAGPYRYISTLSDRSISFFTGSFGQEDKYVIIDFQGEIRNTYRRIDYTSDDGIFAVQSVNGYWGFVDKDGKEVIAPQYEGAHGFNEGLAPVLKDGKWGFINPENETVIAFTFVGEMESFRNGRAVYRRGPESKFGYTWMTNGLIDKQGNIVIEPMFSEIKYLGGNKAIVTSGGDQYLYDIPTKTKLFKVRIDDAIYAAE